MKVAVLGLTFKLGTDDLREAPSIPNVRRLLDEGAEITVYDPVGIDNFKRLYPTEIQYVNNPQEALKNADLAFIFTEWNEIKSLDLNVYEELMNTPVVFDGRNCYDVDDMDDMYIEYHSVGRRAMLNLEKDTKWQVEAKIV